MKNTNSYSYLQELNEVQRLAVENINGASMVIAGAGSGKTRVLTYRIAHMLNMGVRASEVMSLTFTNKAAKEMKSRIASIIGEQAAGYLWMGTFHSIFAKILRFEAEAINYPSSFTIYDTQDSRNLIKTIVKELQLDKSIYKPAEILGRISFAKNNLITAKVYENTPRIRQTDKYTRKPDTYRIYQIYENRCKAAGAMDFDDILMKTNQLFSQFPKILEKYQNRFKYILVDEYQDTNYSQYLIVKHLASKHKNICVVGDDAQSIYAFRGARIENILNFKSDYPNLKTFKLEQNYRSTQNIVNAANSVIKKNKNQIQKNVFSEKDLGNKINVIEAFTDSEEGYLIANTINDSHYRDHAGFDDFAILYRTNAQSRTLEEALRKKNIPYKIFGGTSFYQRKEIKDLISYFRLTINPNDDEAFKRIINYPKRGIGATSIDRLASFANQNQISLWQAAVNMDKAQIKISTATKNQIITFVKMIMSFANAVINEDAYETARKIAVTSGILKDLNNDKSPEGISRYENIQELLNGIKDYSIREKEGDEAVNLIQFVENVSLLTNEDRTDNEQQASVNLMTVHSAKGLEFKHVFIAGMEEELFPSAFSSGSNDELEEERRLFYVAITRAEESLTISYARRRYRWGQLSNCVQSRFLNDIDDKFIEYQDDSIIGASFSKQTFKDFGSEKVKAKLQSSKKPNFNQFNKNKSTNEGSIVSNKFKKINKNQGSTTVIPKGSQANIKVGTIVNHNRFGKGKVLELEGNYPNTKALVEFNSAGKKQLLLRFAKLEIIG